MSDRIHAAALADRLIYGSETTFGSWDARILLPMLPKASWWRRLVQLLPGVRVRGEMPGMSASGAAAGFGNVKMEGEKIKFDLDSHGRVCFRAGQWRIYRVDSLIPGRTHVDIEQVMATSEGDERTARIIYRRGEPKEMRLFQQVEFSIGPVTLAAAAAMPWKTPD